jgi:hypothetical protein
VYSSLVRLSILKWTGAVFFIGLIQSSDAREEQDHGLWFERWLCDTFFDAYRPAQNTQKWDVPAHANTRHGNLHVNPKAVRLGSPVGLGDALRQMDIANGADSFILIAGFWQQSSPGTKSWVNVQAVTVSPATWKKLWYPVTRTDLERFVAVIKDTTLTLNECRRRAQEIKSQPPFTKAILQVNPKIDSSQRRLQCSLSFNSFFDQLLPGASRAAQQNPVLWGVPIPKTTHSTSRSFGKE